MSSPIRQDSRKRRGKNREGISGMNLVFRGSDGRTYASNCFNYLSHSRVSEMGTVAKNDGEVIVELDQEVDLVPNLERQNSSFEEERENVDVPVQEKMEKDGFLEAKAREKAVDAVLGGGGGGGGGEDREISQMGIASSSFENSAIQSENGSVIAQVAGATELPMNIDVQGFMLLMKMLCPVETTIYPGFNGNEVVIGPMDDPSTSKNMKNKPNQEEKRDASSSSPRRSFNFDSIEEIREEELPGEEMKPKYKDNKRDRKEMEGLAAFPELSDSDVRISFS